MRRRRISPTAGPFAVGRRSWRAAVLASAVLCGVPAAALADPIILPDPTAPSDQAELAGAISLLVRSHLKPGARPLVPRQELGLAIEALTGRPPGKTVAVSAMDQGRKLMERLVAESVVLWDLDTSKKGVSVSGTLLGRGGKRLLRIQAHAATGDIGKLAATLARKLAPALGATLLELPDVGLAELRPFVAAEVALLSDDAHSAARAVELAQPGVAERLPAAKEVLRALAENAALPALPRVQARLLRGEWDQAASLAEGGLAKEPRNVVLRAARVRALAALKDFPKAEHELALLKGTRNLGALALAQVALAIARDDPQAKKDEALAPLLGRPAPEWRHVLPLIAATPPGTFGARAEAAALAAAEKLAVREPGLATTLAARALAGGAAARQTAYLIDVKELSREQLKALSIRLTAEADAATSPLAEKIRAREEEAMELEEDVGPERPTGPPSTLARNLLPALQELEGLYEPSLSSIQIAPMPGSGEPFYWPFFVRKHNLEKGLLETLMRPPWELRAARAKMDTELLPKKRFSDEGIASLTHDLGASALLLYRIRPAGLAPWVKVELVLHDRASGTTERIEASLVGRSTGLVMLNPLMVVLAALAFLAALGWAVVMSLRGTIQVRIQWDSDAKDEMFSILISKNPKGPTIENPNAYRKKLEWLGGRKRRFEAWKVDQNTTFRGIPRGKWYVHLYGIFVRGRQTMVLHEPPEEADVLPRKTAFVSHVLEAAEAEFRIKVIDDAGPVEGARVWIDEEHGKPIATPKDGCVAFKVPKGYHVVHVVTRGMNVERPYHVVKAKLHEFTINLVWERRQEYASRALERQTDEAEEYMARSLHKPSGAFPAITAGAPARRATGQVPVVAAGAPVRRATGQVPVATGAGQPVRRATGQVPVATGAGQPVRRATGQVPVAGPHRPSSPGPVPPPASLPHEAVPQAVDSEIVDLTPAPKRSAPARAASPARPPAPRPAAPELPASFGPPPGTVHGLPATTAPATARGLPAAPAPGQPSRAGVSLKPLAPQPAAPHPHAPAGPAGLRDEAPVDLDMASAAPASPAARAGSTGTVRKPPR